MSGFLIIVCNFGDSASARGQRGEEVASELLPTGHLLWDIGFKGTYACSHEPPSMV